VADLVYLGFPARISKDGGGAAGEIFCFEARVDFCYRLINWDCGI
jgi:hypothetical protein